MLKDPIKKNNSIILKIKIIWNNKWNILYLSSKHINIILLIINKIPIINKNKLISEIPVKTNIIINNKTNKIIKYKLLSNLNLFELIEFKTIKGMLLARTTPNKTQEKALDKSKNDNTKYNPKGTNKRKDKDIEWNTSTFILWNKILNKKNNIKILE